MKQKINITLLALLALSGFSSAATISLTNTDSISVFSLVGDASETLLTAGSITLGTYSAEPNVIADVLVNFTSFGSPTSFFGPAAPGFFTGSADQAIGVGSFFDGKTIYAIIGNGATAAASTQFAVWKATSNPAGNTFIADNPIGGPDTLNILTTTGSLLIGSIDNYAVPGFGTQAGFTLIPEPSAALLGALGAFGLLRRRRN